MRALTLAEHELAHEKQNVAELLKALVLSNDQHVVTIQNATTAARIDHERIATLRAKIDAKDAELEDRSRPIWKLRSKADEARADAAEARVKELENISERPHSYKVLCEEIKILRRGEIELKAQLVEAEREWSNLALAIAQSLDPECSDADWSDILGTFDPWDCLRQAHTQLAEAKKDAARWDHLQSHALAITYTGGRGGCAVTWLRDRDGELRAAIDEAGGE